MSAIVEKIGEIRNRLVGKTGVRVFLVEGPDDEDVFRIFLSRQSTDWEKKWLLASAGTKSNVVKMLAKEPDWLGLVDRDEWTPDEIAQHEVSRPNLLILPRFCLESYFVDPVELWDALPAKQRDKIVGGIDQLRQALLAQLGDWIRHAALWHGVRPLWRELRQLGFPDAVLKEPPNMSDDDLLTCFLSWHRALDAPQVLARVHALQADLAGQDAGQVLRQSIYAKSFFPKVVHPVLDELLGQKSNKERRIALSRTRSIPADLGVVWNAMGVI